MNTKRPRRSRRWRVLGWIYVFSLALLLLAAAAAGPSGACADDCEDDLSNLQDCMRTGTFREIITIIAVLWATTPVYVAQKLGVTRKEIDTLINRNWWSPETELADAIRWITGRSTKPPEFRDLPGEISDPRRISVDRIYDGKKAKQILDDLKVLDELRDLDPNDPQKQQKLEMMTHKVKSHRRVKSIAFDWKWVPGPDGNQVQVVDIDNVVIIVEEPETKLPRRPAPQPAKGQPGKGQPAGPQKGQPVKKGSKTSKPAKKLGPIVWPKPPGIDSLYNANPSNYGYCQDIIWARLHNQPPPKMRMDKAKIFEKLVRQYRHDKDYVVRSPADAANIKLKDGDIIMLALDEPVDVLNADHYAIVQGGKIYQIMNLPKPDQGQMDILKVSEIDWFFKPRRIRGQSSNKWHQSDKPYKYVSVYEKK